MSMEIRHDPTNGPLIGAITWRDETPTLVDFCNSDDRCGRCGRPDSGHVWQLVDTDPADATLAGQRGVIDCG